MVSVNRSDTHETERELGHIDLPYGAHVTKKDYAFELNYTDTNQSNPKYLWHYPKDENGKVKDAVTVCPDRNAAGNKIWNFKGWGLGPAGVNMLWKSDTEASGGNEPQAQATDDFYIGSDLLVYAIWEHPICNVTFHLNGGTAATFTTDPDDMITVKVPANTKITENDAKIPRPFYSGYTMEGWYKADENGNIQDPETQFDFNDFITDDIHVAVKWTAKTVKNYTYKVYFVTDNPTNGDRAKEKIYIKDDGQIAEGDTTGAKEYYILDSEESKKMYAPGTTVNLKAQELTGYIPTETNKSLTLNEDRSEYYVIFYYDSYVTGSYIVRFVEAGTEQGANPAVIQQNVISEESVKADKAVLTPSINAVETLKNNGYVLVNRRDSGNTYSPVKKYEDLKWLDSKGDPHSLSVDLTDLLKEDAEKTITYLVQPIVYTIDYVNADNSPAAADDALSEITAAANTPVSSVNGKNPTQYTMKDTFTLKNPAQVYDSNSGKWYQFSHWSLGDSTTVNTKPGDGEYPTLQVDPGTIGNLTFVANWKELTKAGNLTVSKTVSGEAGDKTKEFSFTVILDDTSINGKYGDMEFIDGVAHFTLKHGESMTAAGLLAGIGYVVEESDNEGYTMTASGETGVIEDGKTAKASFNNDKGGNGETPNEPQQSPTPSNDTPQTNNNDKGGNGETSNEPQQSTAPSNDIPKTGDDTNLVLWLILLGVASLAFAITMIRYGRQRNEHK